MLVGRYSELIEACLLLCGSMKGKGNGNCPRPPIKIDGMDAAVFRNLLHFIYTDTLPETAQEDLAMTQHLLVAADRYDVQRLKLICEDVQHEAAKAMATALQ
jgi:speckle-type POZ protein